MSEKPFRVPEELKILGIVVLGVMIVGMFIASLVEYMSWSNSAQYAIDHDRIVKTINSSEDPRLKQTEIDALFTLDAMHQGRNSQWVHEELLKRMELTK